jgi:predicted TIM-barrel fold metal-dependent hydrolase
MNFETYDIHSHSGEQKNNIFEEEKELRKISLPQLIAEYGDRIDKIVNFPMPGTVYFNYEKFEIEDKTSSYPYEIENKELIEAIKVYDKEKKILPFLCINPKEKVDEQIDGLYELITENDIFGIKFHTLDTEANIDDFFSSNKIISFCKEFNLPILIHSGNYHNNEDCNNIFDYAQKNKELNFCIAHLMTFSEKFFKNMGSYEYDNVFTDISPFLGLCKYAQENESDEMLKLDYKDPSKVIEDLFKKYSHFILWGSDEPFGDFRIGKDKSANYSLEDELNFLFSLDNRIIETIASTNSEKFLFNK